MLSTGSTNPSGVSGVFRLRSFLPLSNYLQPPGSLRHGLGICTHLSSFTSFNS